MTTKNIATAILGLAISATFVYRDALAQFVGYDGCGMYYMGCAVAEQPPCYDSGNCAATNGNVPGGGSCTDGKTPQVWSATPASTWSDCIPRTGNSACGRLSKVCETVIYYNGQFSCSKGYNCGSTDVSACASNGANQVCEVIQ